MRLKSLYLLPVLIAFTALAHADIVSYVDDNGKEWFVSDVSQVPAQYKDQAEVVVSGKDPLPQMPQHNKNGFLDKIKEKWNETFNKDKQQKSPTRKVARKKYTSKKKSNRAKSVQKDAFERKREKIRERLTYKPQTVNDRFSPGRRRVLNKGSY